MHSTLKATKFFLEKNIVILDGSSRGRLRSSLGRTLSIFRKMMARG